MPLWRINRLITYLNVYMCFCFEVVMSSEIEKTLKRLADSGFCSCQSDSQHEFELKELAEKTISSEMANKKSKFFKALADPTRLRMLGLLVVREMCVCEVMAALDLTQPTASHHLRILENIGLVVDRKEGKWVFYSLKDPKNTVRLLE